MAIQVLGGDIKRREEQVTRSLDIANGMTIVFSLISLLFIGETNPSLTSLAGPIGTPQFETVIQEKTTMTFVNEYVSEEDIKQYRLDDVWLARNVVERMRGKMPPGFRHQWTIDRERDSYFMIVGSEHRDEAYIECVLYWKGKHFDIHLNKPGEGSNSFDEQPYRIVWGLRRYMSQASETEREEMLQVLKEALTAYGYAGARRQIPNTIVEFKF